MPSREPLSAPPDIQKSESLGSDQIIKLFSELPPNAQAAVLEKLGSIAMSDERVSPGKTRRHRGRLGRIPFAERLEDEGDDGEGRAGYAKGPIYDPSPIPTGFDEKGRIRFLGES
jgi:hypothetical protein